VIVNETRRKNFARNAARAHGNLDQVIPDYRFADEINIVELRGGLCSVCSIEIGLEFLFHNIPIITAEK
jgi:hypothetical protein